MEFATLQTKPDRSRCQDQTFQRHINEVFGEVALNGTPQRFRTHNKSPVWTPACQIMLEGLRETPRINKKAKDNASMLVIGETQKGFVLTSKRYKKQTISTTNHSSRLPLLPLSHLLITIITSTLTTYSQTNERTVIPLHIHNGTLEWGTIRLWHSVWLVLIEGSLEVKLPTVWTDEKEEVGRVSEEKRRSKKIREEKESEERRCRCAKR